MVSFQLYAWASLPCNGFCSIATSQNGQGFAGHWRCSNPKSPRASSCLFCHDATELDWCWVQTLPAFIHYGNANFLNLLPRQLQSNSLILSALIIAILTATSCLAIALGKRLAAQAEGRHSGVGADALLDTPDPWALMAICAIIGMVGLHHRHYDNIMLYPAVLSCWRNTLETPRLGNLGVALLISLTVWTPQSIVELLPAYKEIQLIIWLLVGMAVLLRSLNIKSAEIASAK
jgi:hypothetical protein